MKTFYSILSLNIKPEINERLSFGLIMISGEKVRFSYSKHKLSVIHRLITKETYRAALDYLNLINESVVSYLSINEIAGGSHTNSDSKYDHIFSEQYIQYLSRYSNNLVSFSNVKYLDVEGTDAVFQKLYFKLIDETAFSETEMKIKRIDNFKKEYFPRAKTYFNVERKIDSTNYSELLTPGKMDLMGKNDTEIFVHSIDFEKELRSIEYNVGILLQINFAIPKAKQFVLGYEPGKENRIHHQIWDNVRKSNIFEYVDIKEADNIIDYAKTHNVTPLFD